MQAEREEKTNPQHAAELYKRGADAFYSVITSCREVTGVEPGEFEQSVSGPRRITLRDFIRLNWLKRGGALAYSIEILFQQANQEKETNSQHAAELFKQAAENFSAAADSYEEGDDSEKAAICRQGMCKAFGKYADMLFQQAEQEKKNKNLQRAAELHKQSAEVFGMAATVYEQSDVVEGAERARAGRGRALRMLDEVATEECSEERPEGGRPEGERPEETVDAGVVNVTLPDQGNGNPPIVHELGTGEGFSAGTLTLTH